MENYVIATNSDGRVEAFYIDENSTVMHTWQINPGNKLDWSAPQPLFGTEPNSNGPLNNATRVEATTDANGQIQVVAYTTENQYLTCYQTPGFWIGWFEICQQ
jgi:hypothetical protein